MAIEADDTALDRTLPSGNRSSTDVVRDGSQGEWGYILTASVRGGSTTELKVANAAITFGVTGMVTKNGTNRGEGPYNVELFGDVPATLFEPMEESPRQSTAECPPRHWT